MTAEGPHSRISGSNVLQASETNGITGSCRPFDPPTREKVADAFEFPMVSPSSWRPHITMRSVLPARSPLLEKSIGRSGMETRATVMRRRWSCAWERMTVAMLASTQPARLMRRCEKLSWIVLRLSPGAVGGVVHARLVKRSRTPFLTLDPECYGLFGHALFVAIRRIVPRVQLADAVIDEGLDVGVVVLPQWGGLTVRVQL